MNKTKLVRKSVTECLTDPLSDMLTRIRNGQLRQHTHVESPASQLKAKVLDVLKREGYIIDFTRKEVRPGIATFQIELKYHAGLPVIQHLKRISKPGHRIYTKIATLPLVYGGFGITILSTSRGILSDNEARKQKIGGEVLCHVF